MTLPPALAAIDLACRIEERKLAKINRTILDGNMAVSVEDIRAAIDEVKGLGDV